MPEEMNEQELTLKLPVYAWAALRGAARETIRRNSRRSERNRKPLSGLDLNAERSDTLGFAVEQIDEVLNEAGLHQKDLPGTVASFNADKGYGFIQPDEGGEQAFAHISAFTQGLPTQGALVIYDAVPGRAGSGRPAAINIRPRGDD